MTKRKEFHEGDWFGIPLRSGLWGIGIIVWLDNHGGMLAYFFGPARTKLPPNSKPLDALHHTQAVWRARMSVEGLRSGEWPAIGHHTQWSNELFPNPWFGWVDSSGRLASRAQYTGFGVGNVKHEKCTVREAVQLPHDSVPCYKGAEWVLGEILACKYRLMADPRPDTLDWTDRVPPPLDPVNPYGHPLPAKYTSLEEYDTRTTDLIVITHRFRFIKRADAMALKKELPKRKFESEPIQQNHADDKPFMLITRHPLATTFETLKGECERLRTLAEQHGGEYDGWESEIVPATKK